MSHPYDSEADSRCRLHLRTARVRQRIFVVEDEPSIRALLRLHLSLANFDVAERGDGSEALDLARSEKFDLILLDAIVRGRTIDLTKQEFDLLYLLAARPGIVFSRSALLSKIWSDEVFVTERTVDTVVSRLRKKIEREAQDPELILTAWGVGYKF